MDLEKYTERARGFLQAAQTLALRSGHQRLTAEHLLKVLLDDKEGLAANLIRAAGGDPGAALARLEAELAQAAARSKAPAPASSTWRRNSPACSTRRRSWPRRPATASSPSSGCCSRWRWPAVTAPAGAEEAGVTAAGAERRDQRSAQGPHRAHRASAEDSYDALKKYARDLTAGGARGQARSRHRPRRGNPPHHPGAGAPHQEQSRADRRARRRQDRHRRRPGAAHRQWRRAGEPEGQAR